MSPFSGHRNPYRKTIEAKRKMRAEAIELAPSFEPEEHQKYLDATASQIVENIQARAWTALAVVEAYIARAAQAHQATNCLTEVFFREAKEAASRLDAEFSESGRLKGLLHGVPISVKDSFDVEGFDSTIGYTQWANKPAQRDAAIVTRLREAGAIIIAKTNVPQTLFGLESANPLWGRTSNPWSTAYTAGGTSGGEAALLAADGAAVGIGGSIRIPSGYCGIFGLKPGAGRVSMAGSVHPNPFYEALYVVAGPMGRSVADLKLTARVLFGEGGGRNDYFPAPVPYRDVTLPDKLRFGYYLNDGVVKGSPVCHRAVLETVEALRKKGHECFEIDDPPDAPKALRLFVAITSADGYKKLTEHLGPDQKDKALFLMTLGPRLPGFVRGFARWVIRNLVKDDKFASLIAVSRKTSVHQYYNHVAEKMEFERKTREALWGREPQMDAVLAPVHAIPALPHGKCDRLSPLACSTLIWNMVDSPVGVVPVTRVDPGRDRLTDEWQDAPAAGSKLLHEEIYKPRGAYNPSAMKKLPVGVQVVGRPWEEEKVLAIMQVIDDALGPRGFGPGSWAPNKQVGGTSSAEVD